MKAYCTYCSAQKNASSKTLPAIERYKSERINSVYKESLKLEIEFFIFSGEYGLLHPDDELKYYDHLLLDSEIDSHAKKVTNQIKALGLREIVFFVRPTEQDNNVEVYIDCLKLACEKTGTTLKIVEYRQQFENQTTRKNK